MDIYTIKPDQGFDQMLGAMISRANEIGMPVGTMLGDKPLVVKPGSIASLVEERFLDFEDGINAEDFALNANFKREFHAEGFNLVNILIEDIKLSSPRFELINKDFWETAKKNCENSIAYTAIMDYAEKVAFLLEEALEEGLNIESRAMLAFKKADTYYFINNTPKQTWAVNLLAKTWAHGEELQAWYFNKYPAEASRSKQLF